MRHTTKFILYSYSQLSQFYKQRKIFKHCKIYHMQHIYEYMLYPFIVYVCMYIYIHTF